MYNLTTVSYNEKARQEVYQQLNKLLGNHFQITSYCYNDYIKVPRPNDELVLITTPIIKDVIIDHINNKCKYFLAKRTINPHSLGLLFNIPNDAEVLVVCNLFENSLDLTAELKAIGINHIQLFSFDPLHPTAKQFQYAITPSENALVPTTIPHIIDIGVRLISIMTLAQILLYCSDDPLNDDFLYSRYIRDLVTLTMKLSSQIKQTDLLQQQMKMVISNFEDGIVVTEADKKITFYNSMAASILNQKQLIGKSLDELQIVQKHGEYLDTSFTNIADKVIHIERKEVAVEKNKTIQMITLKDLTKIKNIDAQYKRQKKIAEYNAKYTFENIIHNSTSMSALITKAKLFAKRDSPILISGASGTGKELIAQSIHNASTRSEFPFVAINCAALTETLLESELFGYEDGAFTGARKGGKRGIFEMADDGTIFLDEIGDAPEPIQKKLLRVLQEKEIMKVSGTKVIPINVRVIAATNKDLRKRVEQGLFRQDLYYRLFVLSLNLPLLRDRKEDIEMLLYYFIRKHSPTANWSLDQEIIDILLNYSWPGNIRELENTAEYITALHDTSTDLKNDILQTLHITGDESMATNRPQKNLSFRNPEIKEQLACILQILNKAQSDQILLGRYRLQKVLQDKGFSITTQQIKSRLNTLHSFGLITTYPGKGSQVTPQGKDYLQSAIEPG
jgi:transcriptional regulator with PAS, ATPase and Fis domain